MPSTTIGDATICARPGCDQRAKDARVFCHDDWLRLSNKTRRKIGKLYSDSRRGHHRNPHKAAWRNLIANAITELVGEQLVPAAPPTPVVAVAERVATLTPTLVERIDPDARRAIVEMNKVRRPRQFAHASPELREEIGRRLGSMSVEEKRRVAELAGLSYSTVLEATRGASSRAELTQTAALAIQSALSTDGSGSVSYEKAWPRYLEARLKSGKGWPTPEEAFADALTWSQA